MMRYNVEFSTASSDQIEKELCARLESIRLSRNLSQADLAAEAGVSQKTIGRMERGAGTSLDSFIRVLMALRIAQNLEVLLPDPSIRPIERVALRQKERKRARSKSKETSKTAWQWGDGEGGDGL